MLFTWLNITTIKKAENEMKKKTKKNEKKEKLRVVTTIAPHQLTCCIAFGYGNAFFVFILNERDETHAHTQANGIHHNRMQMNELNKPIR